MASGQAAGGSLLLIVVLAIVACETPPPKRDLYIQPYLAFKGKLDTAASAETAEVRFRIIEIRTKYRLDRNDSEYRELWAGPNEVPSRNLSFRVRFEDTGRPPQEPVAKAFTTDEEGLLVVRFPEDAQRFGSHEHGCRIRIPSPNESEKTLLIDSKKQVVVSPAVMARMWLIHGGK